MEDVCETRNWTSGNLGDCQFIEEDCPTELISNPTYGTVSHFYTCQIQTEVYRNLYDKILHRFCDPTDHLSL